MAAVIHPSEQGQNKGYVITHTQKKAQQSLNTTKNKEKNKQTNTQPCLAMAATTGTPCFCTAPGI